AETAAAAIAQRWRESDAGIWEIDDRPWTHSRLICAAGLRAIAEAGASAARASEWSGLADAIVADTASTSVHRTGRWQRSPADPGLDAALLLPPIRGALPAGDPRTTATLAAYAAELTQDGYAYRFRHDDRPLPEAEGAFLLCGFILSLATSRASRPRRSAGSSGTGPRAGRRACTPRSSTSGSASCAATFRWRSCTP
ncbi:MAG: glycoside hydrolase family 15 protein, partial [Streptosporangiaceae bacterium]